MREVIFALLIAGMATSALALGLGKEGARGGFGGLGAVTGKKGSGSVSTCANDGPDGNVDLSKCSNSFYVATLIFG